jgi:hypothetical protein
VSSRSPGELAGTVRWAIVPYTPRPPFRIYAGSVREPYLVEDVEQLIRASRKHGDADLTYLVPGKARPVLILNNPPRAEHQEVTALRLLRFSKIVDISQQERIRQQIDPLLFHLNPARFDLPEENAAIVSALVTIHSDAIGAGDALGTLNTDEMRALGERIIAFYGFDTRLLVERAIRALVDRRRARGS